MRIDPDRFTPAELADLPPDDPALLALLAADADLAAEVELTRRVRRLLRELQQAELVVPPEFEARLMARVREDKALFDLLDFGFGGLGKALIELLNLLFGLLPAPKPVAA
jgi:hypothetical protein